MKWNDWTEALKCRNIIPYEDGDTPAPLSKDFPIIKHEFTPEEIERLEEEFENEEWSKPYTDIDELFFDLGLTLTPEDIDNFKKTLTSIFRTIWYYNEDREEDTFEVECIGLDRVEYNTLVKIVKDLFTQSEIDELNSRIDVPEARIK